VSVIDKTGDQRDHRRDDRADGEGVDLARLRAPTATARVTLTVTAHAGRTLEQQSKDAITWL
jgi:hypothetical protein